MYKLSLRYLILKNSFYFELVVIFNPHINKKKKKTWLMVVVIFAVWKMSTKKLEKGIFLNKYTLINLVIYMIKAAIAGHNVTIQSQRLCV